MLDFPNPVGSTYCAPCDDTKLHDHQCTDKIYDIIDGQRTMILDDDEIELHRGVVVYVPRGVKHKAIGVLHDEE